MMDGFKDFLETSTYLIVIGETMIKVGRWLIRRPNKKAPRNRRKRRTRKRR